MMCLVASVRRELSGTPENDVPPASVCTSPPIQQSKHGYFALIKRPLAAEVLLEELTAEFIQLDIHGVTAPD
jgi:hypothetical protein